jgi:hypothetical protein
MGFERTNTGDERTKSGFERTKFFASVIIRQESDQKNQFSFTASNQL